MRSRKKPRCQIDLAGRYFTGLGAPVDVVLSDVSEGGCRFPAGAERLVPGARLQLSIAGSRPLRATVRWVEDGEIGVIFARSLTPEQVEQLKTGSLTESSAAAQQVAFEPMPNLRPQRFC
jgi:hypothetical protein